MHFNRRLENWQQAFGVVMLANAALFVMLFAIRPMLGLVAYGAFSLWIGWRLWTVGSARAATGND
jgi:hypothetical protein